MPKIFAFIPAAGQGSRMGEGVPKQYLPLAGRPLLHHAVAVLAGSRRIHRVAVILSPDDERWAASSQPWPQGRVEAVLVGGSTRAQSVANGLAHFALEAHDDDWALVHDAARPCLAEGSLDRLIEAVGDDSCGGLLAHPVADTLKRADRHGRVIETIPREGLWRAQTPQVFRFGLLRRALAARPDATDEAQAVEALGEHPRLVPGEADNFKVTYPEDLALAERILVARRPTT